jgi:hypothetical protein
MVISEYGTKEGVVVIIVVWVVRPTMLPLLTIHLVSLIIYVLMSLTNNAMGNTTGCLMPKAMLRYCTFDLNLLCTGSLEFKNYSQLPVRTFSEAG